MIDTYHHSLTEAVLGHMFCLHCKPFINFSWSTRGSNMWRQTLQEWRSCFVIWWSLWLKRTRVEGKQHHSQKRAALASYVCLRCCNTIILKGMLTFSLPVYHTQTFCYVWLWFSYLSYPTPASGLLLWLSSVLKSYIKSSVSSASR